MNHDDVHPIPWLGEGSVPPGAGGPPRPTRPRGRIGLVAGSLALVLGMGVGGVAVSRLSLGTEQAGSGTGTSQTRGGDDTRQAPAPGSSVPAGGGEEREED
jgi:hypothetical protein